MPRKTLESAVTDFTQAIGLLVRRVRAAAASHELSLDRVSRPGAPGKGRARNHC
jgi:hypothetical protein